MSQNIQAIYENGVFRPLTPLDLPEGSIVWIEISEISEGSAEYMKYLGKESSTLEEDKRKD